jgi:hypothetical protein
MEWFVNCTPGCSRRRTALASALTAAASQDCLGSLTANACFTSDDRSSKHKGPRNTIVLRGPFADVGSAALLRGCVGMRSLRLRATSCLSLLPCEPESSAGRNDSDGRRIKPPASRFFFQAVTGYLTQLPEGVGSSRPLVSLTSGAGGASSPATAGVISAGTEAIVGAGLAVRNAC